MKKIVVFLALIFSMNGLLAQNYLNKWGIGVKYGTMWYRGELGNYFFDFDSWNNGYGFELSRYLTSTFDYNIDLRYNYNSVMQPLTGYSMNGDFWSASTGIKYKLNNNRLLPEDGFLQPYLKANVAFYRGETRGFSEDSDAPYNYEIKDYGLILGGGLKFKLSNNISIFGELGYALMTSYAIDGATSDTERDAFLHFDAGLTFTFRRKNDQDGDGVEDEFDLCPDTPKRAVVDKNGCPEDSDGDGLADFEDFCPDEYGSIENKGCPSKNDNQQQRSGNTNGSPNDQGYPTNFYYQQNPQGAMVPAYGYGVPLTNGINIIIPGGGSAPIVTDSRGNTLGGGVQTMHYDADGDGVVNEQDDCPFEAGPIENRGCPDEDGDGVSDSKDQCPNTPLGAVVLANGCPVDRDGDGVIDAFDQCPDVKGVVSNNGCPEEQLDKAEKVEEKEKKASKPLIEEDGDLKNSESRYIADDDVLIPDSVSDYGVYDWLRLQNQNKKAKAVSGGGMAVLPQPNWVDTVSVPHVYFAVDKSYITDYSKDKLSKTVDLLMKNPSYNVWVFGHADQQGDLEYNKKLSDERVRNVLDYLLEKGVPRERIFTLGFGENHPASYGTTSRDLKLNRRVEFYVFTIDDMQLDE